MIDVSIEWRLMSVFALSHPFPQIQWESAKDALLDTMAINAFWAAAHLTDPICRAHETYRRIHLIDALASQSSSFYTLLAKTSLVAKLFGFGTLALFTTIPGIFLRTLGAALQRSPFIHLHGDSAEKSLPQDRSFSLLSWNICCVGAGYPITDGGVLPWSDRIDAIVDKILEKDADVNCLYETFDTKGAFYLANRLRAKGYTHIYFNMGPRALGVSSGILVASKYSIDNPEFTPFSQETLVGRTKFATKGVFSFDLFDRKFPFARIHATHLQHSAEPSFPTAEEISAREKQMNIILGKLPSLTNRCTLVTGDLNLDDNEYLASSWHKRFTKGDAFSPSEKTWGGDAFCAKMMDQRPSAPLNLDHTLLLSASARLIHTTLVKTDFEGTTFQPHALSDHAGLFTHIHI